MTVKEFDELYSQLSPFEKLLLNKLDKIIDLLSPIKDW